MDPLRLLSWSFPVARLARVPVRAHWDVLLVLLFDLVGTGLGFQFLGHGRWPWWLVPAIAPLLLATYLVHEAGHLLAARWFRGRVDRIELHFVIGGINDFTLPIRPWPLIAYGCAGMLGNGLLAALAWLAASPLVGMDGVYPGIASMLLSYLVMSNLRQLGFNLIFALYPFDLGLILRGVLWPVFGLHRAVLIVLGLGYLDCAALIVSGVAYQAFGLVILGLIFLSYVVQEHRSVRDGFDPWLKADPRYAGSNRPLWHGWSQRRQQRAAERVEREEASEQEVLDRLLAKVSEHGLPSLTAGERAQLERISKRQRARQQVG